MRVTPTFLDGAYLAMTAMDGICAIVDSPRCEMERAYKIDFVGDRASSLTGDGPYARNRRIFAVDWREGRDITGTEDQLRATILRVAKRQTDQPILLFRGFMSLFVNTDIEGVAASLAGEVTSPLLLVEQTSADDDWIDGWQRTHDAVLAHLSRAATDPRPVVTGFCVQRQEGDELGNLGVLQRLWTQLDLPEVAWPMTRAVIGGAADLISPATPRLAFPYAGETIQGSGAEILRLELPIGFELTVRCVRTLAARFDRSDLAERVIAQERAGLSTSLLTVMAERLTGKGAVVVGDPWRVKGFWHALRELGIDVPLAVVLRREDVALPELESLETAGTEIVVFPDGQEIQERLIRGADQGEFHVVVGAGVLRDAADLAGLPTVETCAPYCLEHFAASTPFMGFEGLARLADRLDNALQLEEYRKRRANGRR